MNFSLNFFFFFLLSIPREYISTDFIILATRRIFRIVIQIERNDTIFFFFFFSKNVIRKIKVRRVYAHQKKKKKKKLVATSIRVALDPETAIFLP